MPNTILKLTDILPLTCSRSGNCCHGNKVLLNPWELACMANENKISTREFRDRFTEWCGIRLRFDGAVGFSGKQACSQYDDGKGCCIHIARPLACRLFPLGRQIQNGESTYIHPGEAFPCIDGCSEVLNLPFQSVSDYLIGQQTKNWEIAQNAYLELLQLLADIAFELFLDSGLAESGDKSTLLQWRHMANETPEQLADRIGQTWLENLTIPEIKTDFQQPTQFCNQHITLFREQMQTSFGTVQTLEKLHEATVKVMAMALFLSVSIGTDSELLMNHWIEIAKSNGAQE